MKLLFPFLLVAGVAACAVPGPREPDRYFVLEAPASPASAVRSEQTAAVAPMTVSSFYDTQEIAYSREAGTRAYYRFNFWTERPHRTIQAQIAARLEQAGAKPAVRLRAHLDEIFHDAIEQPGVARITLTAELVDAATGSTLARRTFTRAAPAASYDAPGAVRGFNQALAALIGDVEGWTDTEARRRSGRQP